MARPKGGASRRRNAAACPLPPRSGKPERVVRSAATLADAFRGSGPSRRRLLAAPSRYGRPAPHSQTLGRGSCQAGFYPEILLRNLEIIMRRHQTRSTIMTSNRPLEDWGKLLGDVPSASAILDRFLHHAEIITLQGRSYRLRNRLADDSGRPASEPAARPKPANTPTGNRRVKPVNETEDTTDQTPTT